MDFPNLIAPVGRTRLDARARAPVPPAVAAVEPVVAIERRALFDMNGDGTISNKSPIDGGDGHLVGDSDLDGRVAVESTYVPVATPTRPAPPSETATVAPRDVPSRPDAARVRHAQAAYRAMSGN